MQGIAVTPQDVVTQRDGRAPDRDGRSVELSAGGVDAQALTHSPWCSATGDSVYRDRLWGRGIVPEGYGVVKDRSALGDVLGYCDSEQVQGFVIVCGIATSKRTSCWSRVARLRGR